MVSQNRHHEDWRKRAIELIACYLRVLQTSTHSEDATLAAFYFTDTLLSSVDHSLESYLKTYYQGAMHTGMWTEAVGLVREPTTDKLFSVETHGR